MIFFLLQIAESQNAGSSIIPGDNLGLTASLIKIILALAIVCLIAYIAVRYLLPRASWVRRSRDSEIEIIERFGLEPKKTLYLLKVKDKTLLLGTSDSSLNCLAEWQEISSTPTNTHADFKKNS